MKKTLTLILVGMISVSILAACAAEEGETTTPASNVTTVTTPAPVITTTEGNTDPETPDVTTTQGNTDPETPEVTTTEGNTDPETPEVTTTEGNTDPETPEVTTTEGNTDSETPEVPEKTVLTWYDNNEQLGKQYYDITVNADGSVHVAYTKQTAAEAESSWGYSWANMAADISEVYTDQAFFVIKVQGTAGKTILVKPFDSQSYEKTLTFDGTEQTFTFELKNVPATAAKSIIIFGEGGAVDTSGEFTILDAYFE